MRGNGGGSLVCVMTHMMIIICVVVFGCLASPTESRSQLREPGGATRGNQHTVPNASTDNATVGNFSSDEGKVRVVFCSMIEFCTHHCFCCDFGKKCYETRELCRANCELCDPHCPPSVTENTLVNTTLHK